MSFFKKNVFNFLSLLIGLGGIVATFASAHIQEKNGYTMLLFLTATEIILVLLGVINIKEKHSSEQEIQNLKDKNEKLEKDKTTSIKEKEAFKEKYNYYISSLLIQIKSLSKMHNDFCYKVPFTTQKAYHLIDIISSTDKTPEVIKDEILSSRDSFVQEMFDLYKRYTTNLLTNIVKMVESYIKSNGHNLKVSGTIKLFNTPYIMDESINRSDIVVYSAFRDKTTYETNKDREIGEVSYSIDGNIDFVVCLKKEHYIVNNVIKGSGDYLNEHTDFDNYYNCAVVVAIGVKQGNKNKYFGYLCCDCLNSNNDKQTVYEGEVIFTKEVADILFSMAQLYGNFLETLESNWADKMIASQEDSKSFLPLIYKKTFVGNNKKRK